MKIGGSILEWLKSSIRSERKLGHSGRRRASEFCKVTAINAL